MVLATLLQCSTMFVAIEDPNAAIAWQEYFLQIEGEEYPQDYDFEWTEEAQSRYLELKPIVTEAREIAAIKQCDWDLRYEDGMNMSLPHYSKLRDVQHLIEFSMYGDLQNGHTQSAVDSMNALLGITSHNSGSKTIIGALVTSSAFSLATQYEPLIDSCVDIEQLERMEDQINAMDTFDPFGLRLSIQEEGEMMADWLQKPEARELFNNETEPVNIDEIGIEQYASAMEELASIFRMPNEESANRRLSEWNERIESEEFGQITKMLAPNANRMLELAFRQSEKVEAFKTILNQRLEMFRNPNAATYFLKAVESYNALDNEERLMAIREGDFAYIKEPMALFAKACSMPPVKITVAGSPETPHWIAPLYSLALDCIARGTSSDRLAIIELVGHLSQQDRFAASILAAKLYSTDWGSTPVPIDPHLEAAYERAMKRIPSADEFMLHRSASSERKRLMQRYDMEESWNPNNANTLTMTLTLAKLNGIDECNRNAWKLFIHALGIPDMHPSFLFAEEDYNPELIEYLKLPQEETFDEMLEHSRTIIGRQRYLETTPKER